ncbi:MAG: PASTA domain-containing protein, partial [Marmoricola sp.]
GNVMLTPSGDVKVMDFGIARAMSDAHTMTQTAAVVGTAQYLSPEQARGETVDSRSDVYSTGCLLFELLTGRPPFVGDSPVAVAYQHVREQAPTPSTLDADLPPEIDSIVMKALAKRLEDRYQSAAAMKEDIDRFLAGRPVQAPPVVAEPVPAFVPTPTAAHYDTATTSVVPGAGDWAEPEKRRIGPLVLLGVLLVALIVGAILLIPKLIGSAPQQVSLPHVIGLTQDAAEAKITGAGLTVGEVKQEASDTVETGKVISQSPDPQSTSFVDPNSAVDITVSTGKPDVAIPDIIGDNKNAAEQQLSDLGLKVTLKEKKSDENKDDVLGVVPGVGSKVGAGTRVTIYFSSGPTAVPDVVGKTIADATKILEAAGFKVSQLPDSQSTEPAGTVTQMSPPAGGTQDQGTVITLLVSNFVAPPVESPTDTPTETPTP